MYTMNELPIRDLLGLTVNETTATDLLAKFTSIKEIASAAPEELALVKGLGKVKAKQLLSALERKTNLHHLTMRLLSNVTDILDF